MAFLGGVLVGAAGVLLALRHLDAVEVSGTSMSPALQPGDRLLVESLSYALRRPRRGEVVLAADPRERARELVKRVAAVSGASVVLHGDHPLASTDSRTFGGVPASSVRWRVALRYWPPLRFGGVGSLSGTAEPWTVGEGGEPACTAFGDLVVDRSG